MKRILGILIVLVLFVNISTAQNEEYKSTVCVNAGFSMASFFIKLRNAVADFGKPKSTSYPALQVTYDYGLAKWLSMGVAGSYQMMEVSSFTYINDSLLFNYSGPSNDNVSYKDDLTRLNVAVRALFHYSNSDKIDLYSGIRFGMTNWKSTTNNSNKDYDALDTWGTRNNFATQIVLFGMRGYFTNHFGMNMEFAIGAPHFFSIGLNYRL
jgi:hypothetical protein